MENKSLCIMRDICSGTKDHLNLSSRDWKMRKTSAKSENWILLLTRKRCEELVKVSPRLRVFPPKGFVVFFFFASVSRRIIICSWLKANSSPGQGWRKPKISSTKLPSFLISGSLGLWNIFRSLVPGRKRKVTPHFLILKSSEWGHFVYLIL